MILEDVTRIRTRPERIFRFFEEMDQDHYLAWHPDHLAYRWVKGRGLKEGNVSYFEERINGKLLKKKVRFTRIEPDRHIEFTMTNPFFRLFLPRFLFHFEPKGDECEFTAQIHLRLPPISRWLNRKDLAAVRQHMKEEDENLKRLLEHAGSA